MGPTWHTHKKCGKIPLGLPTCGSHFDELTLGKLGKNVWQSVAMLGLEPNNPFATTNLRQSVAATKSVAMATTSVARFGKKMSL